MPIFRLSEQLAFPHPELADESGLLAVGGDLSTKRLLTAYRFGIFPWYGPGDPLLWWFISPRLVIFLDEFHIPKRVARYFRTSGVTITYDQDFAQVIGNCEKIRSEVGERTWISPEIKDAYISLHKSGYAHSVECWRNEKLVGGLYGVALGQVFFGESMFSRDKGASQFGLIGLVRQLQRKNYQLIDCQMTTNHLLRFGAREIEGREFLQQLELLIPDIQPQSPWTYEHSAKA
jgi:leucyl/phenylalanyl-tRNA--protein transferase